MAGGTVGRPFDGVPGGLGCIFSSNARVVDGDWLVGPAAALEENNYQNLLFNAPHFGKGADAYVTYTMPSGGPTKINVHISDDVSGGTGVPYTTCEQRDEPLPSDEFYRCQITVQDSRQASYTTRIAFVPAAQAKIADNQRCAYNRIPGDAAKNCTATMQFSPVRSPTMVTIRTAISALTPGHAASVYAYRPNVGGLGRVLCVAAFGNRTATCHNVKLYPDELIGISGALGTGNRSYYSGAAWAELSDVRPIP